MIRAVGGVDIGVDVAADRRGAEAAGGKGVLKILVAGGDCRVP
jgi:hypothetical protein